MSTLFIIAGGLTFIIVGLLWVLNLDAKADLELIRHRNMQPVLRVRKAWITFTKEHHREPTVSELLDILYPEDAEGEDATASSLSSFPEGLESDGPPPPSYLNLKGV